MAQEKQDRPAADNGSESRSGGIPRGEMVLMHLGPGERFYKFYILSEPRQDSVRVEHRIITKEHADGSLEMVSYNAWLTDGQSEKRDVIRVPSLSKALFEQIVERVRTQSAVPDEAFREIDLSRCQSVKDQLDVLARLGLNA